MAIFLLNLSKLVALFSSTAGLQPAELIVYLTDVFVCLCGCVSSNFLQITTASTVCPILVKLGAHDPCASTQNNCGIDFRNFVLKFLTNFLNFKLGLGLWNSLN